MVVCAGAVELTEKGWRARLCGLMAGLLFVLIHLRDGVIQGGQRDLVMAVLVLMAYIALLRLSAVERLAGLVIFELLIGVTLTIKPTLLPLAGVPLLLRWKREERLLPPNKTVMYGLIAVLLPGVVMLLWLLRRGSLVAFVRTLLILDVAHGTLARENLAALLVHSIAPIPVTFVLGIILAIRLRPLDTESKLLLAGAACGLLSFVAQTKGFPYQRYPFLLLSLVLIGRLLAKGLAARGVAFASAVVMIAFNGLWLVPIYAATVCKYDHSAPFDEALTRDLMTCHAGSGDVQCMDTVGGCVKTLYDLRLVQSTGFLYDCYAYQGSDQAGYRTQFLVALVAARPRTIVLTDQFCLDSKHSFTRIQQWPELNRFLVQNYRLDGGWQPSASVRWWNERERPPGYKIFTLK